MEARVLAGQHQCQLSFTTPGLGQQEMGIITAGHRLCVYFLSTWCLCTWPNLPGLPLPYLHVHTGWPGNETNLRLSGEIKPWEVIHSSQTIYFLQVALTARRGLVVMFLFFYSVGIHDIPYCLPQTINNGTASSWDNVLDPLAPLLAKFIVSHCNWFYLIHLIVCLCTSAVCECWT